MRTKNIEWYFGLGRECKESIEWYFVLGRECKERFLGPTQVRNAQQGGKEEEEGIEMAISVVL